MHPANCARRVLSALGACLAVALAPASLVGQAPPPASSTATDPALRLVFAQDSRHHDPTRLSTFLDNHDVWRFTSEAEAAGIAPAEATQRLGVALTVLYLARGIPVIYYGTEIAMRGQGDSWDKPIGGSSREDIDFTQLAASVGRRAAACRRTRADRVASRRCHT